LEVYVLSFFFKLYVIECGFGSEVTLLVFNMDDYKKYLAEQILTEDKLVSVSHTSSKYAKNHARTCGIS
jgi:hypothetical protein